MKSSLDDSVRKFKGYCNGDNAFDELDFKAEVWEFIQSECLDELNKYNKFLQKNGYTDSDIDLEEPTAINRYLADQRARLMERMK